MDGIQTLLNHWAPELQDPHVQGQAKQSGIDHRMADQSYRRNHAGDRDSRRLLAAYLNDVTGRPVETLTTLVRKDYPAELTQQSLPKSTLKTQPTTYHSGR